MLRCYSVTLLHPILCCTMYQILYSAPILLRCYTVTLLHPILCCTIYQILYSAPILLRCYIVTLLHFPSESPPRFGYLNDENGGYENISHWALPLTSCPADNNKKKCHLRMAVHSEVTLALFIFLRKIISFQASHKYPFQ